MGTTGNGSTCIMIASLVVSATAAAVGEKSYETLLSPVILCKNRTGNSVTPVASLSSSSPATEATTTAGKLDSGPGTEKRGFFGELDAFCYIVIVLSFYAISIVLLMIKYIRREQEEISLDYYYTEFVTRPWFSQPRVQNGLELRRQSNNLRHIHNIVTRRGEGEGETAILDCELSAKVLRGNNDSYCDVGCST